MGQLKQTHSARRRAEGELKESLGSDEAAVVRLGLSDGRRDELDQKGLTLLLEFKFNQVWRLVAACQPVVKASRNAMHERSNESHISPLFARSKTVEFAN
jgi:hypothetical protein